MKVFQVSLSLKARKIRQRSHKQKNSKHRGLFKPPSTPERFWDPEIVEDGPDDPRSKIIDAPPLKKRKGAKMFAVGEIVNGDEFDLE